MKQTNVPGEKPESVELDKSRKHSKENRGSTEIFLFAVLDLSWQMAIVVLVPIIGGFEIDKHTGTTPVFTIIGFLLAMLGSFVVMKRVYSGYNNTLNVKEHK